MVIKNVELEIVCGVTSKLPRSEPSGSCFCRKIKCRKIVPDQCVDESEGFGAYICDAGKNTDDQLL